MHVGACARPSLTGQLVHLQRRLLATHQKLWRAINQHQDTGSYLGSGFDVDEC